MSLLLYCVSRLGAVPATAGVGGRPVRDLEWAGLRASVSALDERSWVAQPGPQQLLAYDRVVTAAHRRGAAIPLRYGAVAADDEEVRSLVDANRDGFETALDRVDGRDEVGLCLTARARPDVGAAAGERGAGREYLRACQSRFRQQEGAAAELTSAIEDWRHRLAGLSDASQAGPLRPVPGEGAWCQWLYLLVPRDRRPEVARRVDQGRGPRPAATSGPGPPYHFASAPGVGRERRAAAMADAP